MRSKYLQPVESQAYLMTVRVMRLAVIGLALLAVPLAVEAEGPVSEWLR